jgi:mRNA interferase MazF
MTARGAIHWADLDPTVGHEQAGRRPVLIVSSTKFNEASSTAIAFPLTSQSQRLGYPFTSQVPPGVLDKPSWVKLTQVRTIDVRRLGAELGRVQDPFVQHCLAGLLRHCAP